MKHGTLIALGMWVWLGCGSWGQAGTSNSLLDISADGKLLACSNRDSGTVTIVDLQTLAKLYEVPVGHKPEGVSFVGQTHELAVAVYADDKIVLINADDGTSTGQTDVFDEPYGVVSTPDGQRLYVTLDYPGRIVEIAAGDRQVVRELAVGSFTRGIALESERPRAYVTEYYTATVKAVDLASGAVVDEWPGASSDNLARQIVLNPRRPKAYVPHMRSKIQAVHGEGSIFPYVGVMDTNGSDAARRKRIPMDAFRGALVTANPWEVAVAPDGRTLYVVFAGTDDMFVAAVVDDDYRELEYRQYLRIGSNPRAVRVSPDGSRFYVYNALDFNVVAYDAQSLQVVGEVRVTDNPLGAEVLLGKKLFYSALQPMVGRRWISCSRCHPDVEPDGRTWHNPEGLRNTQSLAGMAWTHPIHWSADRDEVQDFEHTIRGPLMQGQGLIRGVVKTSLGEPNKGLSHQLDALAVYSNSHRFTLSPHAKSGLSEAAERGRTLFLSDEVGCAKCHSGPIYTDSQPREPSKYVMHDVGTCGDDPSEKLGPAFDTPTLLGVYRTAPYLHDGKAATLQDVLTIYNKGDRHGRTSHLSAAEVSDLVEFLKALPYEDPEPQAASAGLPKVSR